MDPAGCRGDRCGVETRPRRGCGAVSVGPLPKADGLRGQLVGSRGGRCARGEGRVSLELLSGAVWKNGEGWVEEKLVTLSVPGRNGRL